jgi:hypothetical protein
MNPDEVIETDETVAEEVKAPKAKAKAKVVEEVQGVLLTSGNVYVAS